MGERQERRKKLTGEIRKRLETVCSNLSESDFQDLIEKIADNHFKDDARFARSTAAAVLERRTQTGRTP